MPGRKETLISLGPAWLKVFEHLKFPIYLWVWYRFLYYKRRAKGSLH